MFDELRRRIERNEIRLLIGGGVAMATCREALSWRDTVLNGYDFILTSGLKRPGWVEEEKEEIEQADISQLVRKAENLVQTLRGSRDGEPWRQWLKLRFGDLEPERTSLIEAILGLRLQIMTTNFDFLIEKVAKRCGSRLTSVSWDEHERIHKLVESGLRGSVVHLHGHWKRPDSVVFDISKYKERSEHGLAETAQRMMTAHGLLYIGCGATLDDPNLGTLRRWHSKWGPQAGGAFFRLMRNDEENDVRGGSEVDGINIVRYGDSHNDLVPFLRSLKPTRPAQPQRRSSNRTKATLTAYLHHTAGQWGKLDLPVPPGSSSSHAGLVEALYVQRSFRVEELGQKQNSPDTTFAGQARTRHQDNEGTASLARVQKSFAELLVSPTPQLVVAVAGMGKTALSRRVAWAYARRRIAPDRSDAAYMDSDLPDRPWIPILVPGGLVREEDATGNVRDLICAALRVPGFDPNWLDPLHDAARAEKGPGVLLILDGLDEIWPRSLRERVVGALLAVAIPEGHNQLIVTSRRDGLERPLRDLSAQFDRSELLSLSDTQVQLFLERYIGDPGASLAKARHERIRLAMQDPRINEIGRTPLGLAMLAQRSAYPGAGSEDLSGLLRWMISELIERRGNEVVPALEARDVVPLMQFLALESLGKSEQEAIPRGELEAALVRAPFFERAARGRDAREFLDVVIDVTNLLIKRGVVDSGFDEDVFGFLFKQFREFLAAGDIVWGRHTSDSGSTPVRRVFERLESVQLTELPIDRWDRRLTETIVDPRWQEVLALSIAQMNPDDAEEALRVLVAPIDDKERQRALLVLAVTALAELRDPARSTVAAIAQACVTAMDFRDDSYRETALVSAAGRLLKGRTGEIASQSLSEGLLRSRDWDTKLRHAILLLSRLSYTDIDGMGASLEVPGLLDDLESSDDLRSQNAALHILEIGYRSEKAVVDLLAPEVAADCVSRLLAVAMSARPTRTLASFSLAWLVKAPTTEPTGWRVDQTFLTKIAKGVADSSIDPIARGFLCRILGKLAMADLELPDYIYEWAVICDTPGQPHKAIVPLPKAPAWLQNTIVAIQHRLDTVASSTFEARQLAFTLGRFGALTQACIPALRTYLLQEQPWRSVSEEAIIYIASVRSEIAEKALLEIYEKSNSSEESFRCFVALIANGSNASWRAMRDIQERRNDLRSEQGTTTEAFLALESRTLA